jgi:hypothetical protein
MQGTGLLDTLRSFTAHIMKVIGLTLEFRGPCLSKRFVYETNSNIIKSFLRQG